MYACMHVKTSSFACCISPVYISSVCVYVCMYLYSQLSVNTCMLVCMRKRRVLPAVCLLRVCHVCVRVCVCMHKHVFVCVCVCVCVCVYVHM